MQTIKQNSAFNERTKKARMSAGWSQDDRHYRFERVHPSRAPFVDDRKADSFADALIGVIALAALFIIVLLVGGAY